MKKIKIILAAALLFAGIYASTNFGWGQPVSIAFIAIFWLGLIAFSGVKPVNGIVKGTIHNLLFVTLLEPWKEVGLNGVNPILSALTDRGLLTPTLALGVLGILEAYVHFSKEA